MMHCGVLMPVRRASGPWILTILCTYTTLIPTSPVVCVQRKFGQGPSPLIVPYIMLIHRDALHMSWNQDFRMVKSCQSGCQGLGEIIIWEPLLCITAQWDWSGTYKLATSDLIFIFYLVTILRLCMQ